MPYFRKKPVTIEAVEFRGFDQFGLADFSGATRPQWLTEALLKRPGEVGSAVRFDPDLVIHTLEGEHRANPGDWIIRGVKGELYPCKPDIFAITYEPVDSPIMPELDGRTPAYDNAAPQPAEDGA
jgi:hypothetical protein